MAELPYVENTQMNCSIFGPAMTLPYGSAVTPPQSVVTASWQLLIASLNIESVSGAGN